MREARRLALLRRQRLIADVTRKQALRHLAEALEAEARSAAISTRSRMLMASGAPVPGETSGAAMAGRAAFTAGMAQLARNAGDAARDAARQRAWQADSLAHAEARARRLRELEAEARTALEAVQERREQARELPLARKLQRGSAG